MEVGSLTTVASGLDAVSTAVDEVMGAPLLTTEGDELLAGLDRVLELRNRLDSLCGEIALAAEQSRAPSRAGSPNTATWVGANTAHAPADTRRALRSARWLIRYREFADAHAAGVLSSRHVDVLRGAENPRTARLLLRDQTMLVEFAEQLGFDQFKVAVQYWVNAADPDGEIPNDQLRKSSVTMRRRGDGSLSLSAELDPLLGTAVYRALTAETEKVRAADAEAQAIRPLANQRAQALGKLVGRGYARRDGTVASPLVNVVMGERVAEALLRGEAPDLDPFSADGRCEFIDGTPLHPKLALAALGVGVLRRIVLDAKSRPIDVSYNARAFPQWMKDAALIASRGRCSTKGCDAPFHWLQADHVKPHGKGGPTSLDNVAPLCGPENRAKSDAWDPAEDPGWDTDSPAA